MSMEQELAEALMGIVRVDREPPDPDAMNRANVVLAKYQRKVAMAERARDPVGAAVAALGGDDVVRTIDEASEPQRGSTGPLSGSTGCGNMIRRQEDGE